MTRDYLTNMLKSSNWIKTKEYEEDGIVYQKHTIDDDFIEITMYPVRYEIEYFTKTGHCTYNSFILCKKFFSYEYDDENVKSIEQICFTVEESLPSNEDK